MDAKDALNSTKSVMSVMNTTNTIQMNTMSGKDNKVAQVGAEKVPKQVPLQQKVAQRGFSDKIIRTFSRFQPHCTRLVPPIQPTSCMFP